MKIHRLIAVLFVGTLISILSSNLACAQNKEVSGKIVDANENPIAGAFVSILHENKVVSYTFSGNDGCFSIKCPNIDSDEISISLLGYAPVKQPVKSESNILIRLREAPLSIKAAKVSGNVVEEKGDTLSYVASAFRETGDLAAADLLKKIPGITITSSGGVIYNGSYINKFYVDGMDLMGSRYGVVTNNLDPDKIAKVEVYRKHQPVKALQGIVQTDKSAVNIILKEGAKNSWMLNGDLLLGASAQTPLFDARAMIMRFSKKSQDLYLVKGNNTGKDIMQEIREQAYFGKTGVIRVTEGSVDSDFTSRLNPYRTILELPKDYWYNNISGIVSLNHLQKFRNELQLKISLHLASERYNEENYICEDVAFTDGSGISIKNGSSMSENRNYFSANFAIEKNTNKNYISDDLIFSGQWVEDSSFSESGSQNYTQQYHLPSFKIENDLKTVIRRKDNRSMDVSSNTQFILNNHSAIFDTDGTVSEQTLQCIDINSVNSITNGFRIKKVNLETISGVDFDFVRRISVLESVLDEDIVKTGVLSAVSVSPRLGLNLRTYIGKSNIRMNIPFKFNSVFVCGKTNLFYPTFSPNLNISRNLWQNFEVSAAVNYRRSRSNTEDLLDAAIMQTYRTIVKHGDMSASERASASATLKYANNPAMFYANVSASCSINSTDRTTASTYSDNYTILSFIPTSIEYRSYGFNGDISKYFGVKTLVMDLSGGYEQYKSGEYLQGQYSAYFGNQTHLILSLRSSAIEWLSAEASANYTFSKVYGSSSVGQERLKTSAKLTLKPYKKLFVYADLSHFCWRNTSDLKNTYNIPLIKTGLNLSVGKFTISAECRNVLGIKELKNESINPHGTISYNYNLRGREFIAGVRMAF